MGNLFRIPLFLALIFVAGCKTTKVQFNYLGPAGINIPSSIQQIVVVDHSAPKDQIIDVIEGGLTGEGIGQDLEGILHLIDGLKRITSQSNRYVVLRENKRYGKGKLLENIPEPMDLSLIRSIGQKHNADAVLAIDKFDSDFIVTHAKVEYDADSDVPEEERKKKAYRAEGVATITAYIRLYQTSSGEILDEIKLKESFTWSTYGETVQKAVLDLLAKQEAVNRVSRQSGETYGRRIAPSVLHVTRKFYKKPKDHQFFSRGVRKAEVGNWEGAIEDWKQGTKSGELKVRQRSAYNLAVAYEVLGQLYTAHDWAQKAYADFGEKRAVDYAQVLQNRIFQHERLQEQMGDIEEHQP